MLISFYIKTNTETAWQQVTQSEAFCLIQATKGCVTPTLLCLLQGEQAQLREVKIKVEKVK